MTARRSWSDAETVAQRMNARILPEDCDGGQWDAVLPCTGQATCDACDKVAREIMVATDIGGGSLTLCLDCALLDCMGVKS